VATAATTTASGHSTVVSAATSSTHDTTASRPVQVSNTATSGAGASGSTLTTTFHHPFYDETQAAFIQAQYLHVGDLLQTPDGGTAAVTTIHLFHANTTTYDLTIGTLHTYYVLAGATPVLVHNCNDSLQEYADSLRPGATKRGPHVAAEYTSPSGETYHGYNGHGLSFFGLRSGE
jgi:hypothetical protein